MSCHPFGPNEFLFLHLNKCFTGSVLFYYALFLTIYKLNLVEKTKTFFFKSIALDNASDVTFSCNAHALLQAGCVRQHPTKTAHVKNLWAAELFLFLLTSDGNVGKQ